MVGLTDEPSEERHRRTGNEAQGGSVLSAGFHGPSCDGAILVASTPALRFRLTFPSHDPARTPCLHWWHAPFHSVGVSVSPYLR
jgi:hypothetical protein